MSDYKYPFIPKPYYPAVMFACSCIRKYGTFNVAVRSAAKKYGLDEDEIAKHVRKRQGAGQKGQTRNYKYYVVTGLTDEWWNMGDYTLPWSQAAPEEWKEKRKRVATIIKATSADNAVARVANSHEYDRDTMEPAGTFWRDITCREFNSKSEADAQLDKMRGGIK